MDADADALRHAARTVLAGGIFDRESMAALMIRTAQRLEHQEAVIADCREWLKDGDVWAPRHQAGSAEHAAYVDLRAGLLTFVNEEPAPSRWRPTYHGLSGE